MNADIPAIGPAGWLTILVALVALIFSPRLHHFWANLRDNWNRAESDRLARRAGLDEAKRVFLLVIRPIKSKIENERGSPKNIWLTTYKTVPNACEVFASYLDRDAADSIREAGKRYGAIDGGTFEPASIPPPPGGGGVRPDYTRAKDAMLGPLGDMERIADGA